MQLIKKLMYGVFEKCHIQIKNLIVSREGLIKKNLEISCAGQW